MLGYVCKYTPIEVFEAMGVEIQRIEPSVTGFSQADTWMHPNMCSFSKAVLEDFAGKDYEGVILTTCCDSIRRLYDTLVRRFPDKFFYLLDLPRKVSDFSAGLYETQIRDMISAYEAFHRHSPKTDCLPQQQPKEWRTCASPLSFQESELYDTVCWKNDLARLAAPPRQDHVLHIGLAGARPGNDIRNLLENMGAEVIFDLTCTGIRRTFRLDETQILRSYAKALLSQLPCMRMMEAADRSRFLDSFRGKADGILYHTIQFCDIYSYEYQMLRERKDLPLVLVETDATRQCSGQIRTRVEAFLESLRQAKGIAPAVCQRKRTENGHMYVLGIDSGSTSTNAVILDERKTIKASAVIRTGAKSAESADRILKEILDLAGLSRDDISCIVSTGYGRVSIPFADSTITEISCHGRGAHFLNPQVRTILDIGGQDSKAIRLNEKGEVEDFVMNDKCAAGTGRFLEMMARTLELSTNELGPVSAHWTEDIEISSMCSVFAESEVISLIAQNKEKADIVHGIHKAIAGKALSLMKRVGIESVCMMTGGVAKNTGVVRVLEEKLNDKLFIYEEPEIVGALGAALFALEKL